MRVSLEQVRKKFDMELKRVARTPQASDSVQAFDLVEAIAIEAPPTTPAVVRDWALANASNWLWASEAHKGAFVYNGEKLLAAATMRAAKFGVTCG